MQSRFVNEYRFEEGGKISGDYKFRRDHGIVLDEGSLKGQDDANITFPDNKIKLKGQTRIECGEAYIDVL